MNISNQIKDIIKNVVSAIRFRGKKILRVILYFSVLYLFNFFPSQYLSINWLLLQEFLLSITPYYLLFFIGSIFFILLLELSKIKKFIFIVCLAVILSSFYMPYQIQRNSKYQDKMTLFFQNVLYKNTNYRSLENEITKLSPDIVVLVEFSAYWQNNFDLSNEYPYHTLYKKDYLGMVVYSKYNILDVKELYYDDIRPILHLKLQVNNNKNVSLNVLHASAPYSSENYLNRNSFFKQSADYFNASKARTIVVGDFNTTHFSPILRDFIKNSHLKCSETNDPFYFSWCLPSLPFICVGIDHLFFKGEIALEQFKQPFNTGSDHKPILAEFSL